MNENLKYLIFPKTKKFKHFVQLIYNTSTYKRIRCICTEQNGECVKHNSQNIKPVRGPLFE
jgi:hypothetical protein